MRHSETYRLEVIEISKSFSQKPVVKAVSLQVQSGEVVGLLGPNGAGKTTCFNIIVGLEVCDSGTIILNSENVTKLPLFARAKIGLGYLPQESSIFRRLNVEENILAILQLQKGRSRLEQKARLEELLDLFNLDGVRRQLGSTLSGGERRRVEIARSLAMDPRFILLDEPFAGVDPIAIHEVMDMIKLLSKMKVGVLITDHNVRETLKICNCAHIMNRGEIIVSGNAEEVLKHPDSKKFYFGQEFEL